jgi:hypothetical protein
MRRVYFALLVGALATLVGTLSSANDQQPANQAAAKKPVPKPSCQTCQTKKPEPPCPAGQEQIILGVLTGTDADAVAATLSTVFSQDYIITSKASSASGQGTDTESPGAASKSYSAGASKHLCLSVRPSSTGLTTRKKLNGKLASVPKMCSGSVPEARCNLDRVLALLDQDNFKGMPLNSNFMIKLSSPTFPPWAYPAPSLIPPQIWI